MRTFCTAAVILGACAPASPTPSAEAYGLEQSAAYVYRCDGDRRFILRTLGDSVRLQRELLAVTLPVIDSASGVRYHAGGTTLWTRGSEARLHTETETLEGCRGTIAPTPWEVSRLLGYDFRAIGQEPGWVVEVDLDHRMHVLADYGEIEFYTPPPDVRSDDEGVTIYRAEAGGRHVTLSIRETPCADAMSGERFPTTAVLTLEEAVYHGCGRFL